VIPDQVNFTARVHSPLERDKLLICGIAWEGRGDEKRLLEQAM
jgi:hypothetical protein